MALSTPHGGKLINRFVDEREVASLSKKAKEIPSLVLSPRELSDLDLIAEGVLSPLTGFMGSRDYKSVLANMRLANNLPWTIPVTLSITKEEAVSFEKSKEIALFEQDKAEPLAILTVDEIYPFDKNDEAKCVYGTTDTSHPGVAYTQTLGDFYIAGQVDLLRKPTHTTFTEYRKTPQQTRALFEASGWKKVVAFQTRNPIHRAHEYIQKCALEMSDGLLIHPLAGETKGDDIPVDVRMNCYKVLIDNYYNKDRTVLSIFPAAMRYAGPKEAIFHAICRKNYGATHFIVGRDHAGVGSFYGPFDAQQIFKHFPDLGIEPIFFDNAFYCKKCLGMVSAKICSHDASNHVALSGTRVREMLRAGETPPAEFTRPEVAKILVEAMRIKAS
ncbi:MAG: sulfate adenylyltransferase [Nitrospirota bacterium]